MMHEVETEAARMEPEIEAEATRIQAEAMREAAAGTYLPGIGNDCRRIQRGRLEGRGAPRVVGRENYVAKEDEGRYLRRRANGLPNLYLVDAGDRLAIWSPVDGGGLINPKGPGVRSIGLYASYARGTDRYQSAYRAADLSKGALRR